MYIVIGTLLFEMQENNIVKCRSCNQKSEKSSCNLYVGYFQPVQFIEFAPIFVFCLKELFFYIIID